MERVQFAGLVWIIGTFVGARVLNMTGRVTLWQAILVVVFANVIVRSLIGVPAVARIRRVDVGVVYREVAQSFRGDTQRLISRVKSLFHR
jgi:hypothetical protein